MNLLSEMGEQQCYEFVFQPNSQTHTLSRVTPVQNITDDLSWIHGNHVIQFGTNIRIISNSRTSYANAFDFATTNPSFYQRAGESASNDFQSYLPANGLPGDENAGQSLNSVSEIQNAGTAIIGRLSEYTADFTFNRAGDLQNQGTATKRTFATQAYDWYVQDAWKIRPHLTLTLGLRYSLERPVYETHGYQVEPTIPLGTYFQNRLNAAKQGENYTEPIVINLSGPANGGKPMYNWDKNNFQPRIAVAWSPSYGDGVLHSIFGNSGQSVIRGGFALTNDYYGQALAVDFDLNNTLGFTSNYTTPANTYGITTDSLAPQFTGFNQDVRSLPNVVTPPNLTCPQSQPLDERERIESSIDSNLHAPTSYVWNITFERQLPKGFTIAASYIGRQGRGLLARRDVAAFNDVRDPKSGMDWYTAGTMLEKQRQQGVPTSQIASIPFFDNLFPANFVNMVNADPGVQSDCGTDLSTPCFNPAWSNTQLFYAFQSRSGPSSPEAFFSGNDWTDTQAYLDKVLSNAGQQTRFMQQQYGALSAWSTIGNSSYHGFTFTARQRLNTLLLDFNYTFSHSADDSSGLQTASAYGSAFITNPINQRSGYGNSDFDIRHLINASAVWQMPFGKGRAFLNTENKAAQAVLGGWQLSGIYRWNTGLPLWDSTGLAVSPFDDARWATNWNVQANFTSTSVHTCPNRTGTPKLFGGTGCDITAIYQGFRNAYPGEAGPRNYLRLPGYMNFDLGLAKSFNMPWSEKQQRQFRWDVFNVANFQPFGTIDTSRTGIGVARDPGRRGLNPPDNWSNFTAIQGAPRVMQVGLRFSF